MPSTVELLQSAKLKMSEAKVLLDAAAEDPRPIVGTNIANFARAIATFDLVLNMTIDAVKLKDETHE